MVGSVHIFIVVCLFEIYDYYYNYITSQNNLEYLLYATCKMKILMILNIIKESQIYHFIGNSGFKIYKLNKTQARCLMKNAVFDISLSLKSNGVNKIAKDETNPNLYDFNVNVDLFDYSNNLVFSTINTNFMNNNDIISFTINKEISNNYFKLYNYKENNIKKILCYYDEENYYILFIYQSPSNIKYFTLKDNRIIYNIDSISDTIQMKTYEKIEYNINGKFKEI